MLLGDSRVAKAVKVDGEKSTEGMLGTGVTGKDGPNKTLLVFEHELTEGLEAILVETGVVEEDKVAE